MIFVDGIENVTNKKEEILKKKEKKFRYGNVKILLVYYIQSYG